MMEVPDGYETWSDAIGAYVGAREGNETPDTVNGSIWKVFETMAFTLIPEINL
jgi:hypothetical protein